MEEKTDKRYEYVFVGVVERPWKIYSRGSASNLAMGAITASGTIAWADFESDARRIVDALNCYDSLCKPLITMTTADICQSENAHYHDLEAATYERLADAVRERRKALPFWALVRRWRLGGAADEHVAWAATEHRRSADLRSITLRHIRDQSDALIAELNTGPSESDSR